LVQAFKVRALVGQQKGASYEVLFLLITLSLPKIFLILQQIRCMSKKQIAYLILAAHFLIVLLYHWIGYLGHFGFDDLVYAKLAHGLNQGNTDFSDHFSFRFPLLWLTALSYRLFGVHDLASAIPSFIITGGILGFVFKILFPYGNRTLAIGLSLTCFSQWIIFYSDKIMPDIYVAFSVLACVYFIYKEKFSSKNNKSIINGFLLSFSFLFGFATKGTIVLFIPVLVILFLVDVFNKRQFKFWLSAAISMFFLLILYLGYIWQLTGEPLTRFLVIADNSYLNFCSYDQQSTKVLLKRIGYQFFELIFINNMLTSFTFLLAFLFRKDIWTTFKMETPFSFFYTIAILLLLSANFMTISFSSYVPMCLDVRHYLFIPPVVAIPGAIIIDRFIIYKKLAPSILIVSLILAILSYGKPEMIFWTQYFPLFGLLFLWTVIKKEENNKIFTGLLLLVLFLPAMRAIKYAREINFPSQRAVLKEEIFDRYDTAYIITNPVQAHLGNYYNAFGDNGKYTFLTYGKFDIDTLDNRKKLLFTNWYPRFLSNINYESLPYYVRNIDSENRLVYENKNLNVFLYELNKIKDPKTSGKILLETKNDFESTTPNNWNEELAYRTNSIKHGGSFAQKIEEYSFTFFYELKNLPEENISQLSIQAKAFTYWAEETQAQLVISIENKNGENYSWNGKNIQSTIQAYSNWWPIEFNVEVSLKDIPSDAQLKVFVWNKEKSIGYLDDFSVEVRSFE
jgi:hypothetical protein